LSTQTVSLASEAMEVRFIANST